MNFIQKKIKELTDEKKPDYILLFISSILIIISIIFSYSLSVYTVVYWDYNSFHFFIRQFIIGTFAILVMWGLAHTKPQLILSKIGWFLFLFFLFLIIIMQFLPESMVSASGGAKRWIRLPGISLSPVEFFKIGFIYLLAYSFTKRIVGKIGLSLREELKLLIPYAVIFGLVVLLIAIFQKDLGQIVVLTLIIFTMLIFSDRSLKLFLSIIFIAILGFVALIISANHRIQRVLSWWGMIQDSVLSFLPTSFDEILRVKDVVEPYQVSNSLNAIYNGGFFGVGMGEGLLKLGFLSEVHTDFVLAGIIEEIGLLGFFVILSLIFIVIVRIFKISRRIENIEYHLFTLGIGTMITVSFLINSYGISGIIPIKGIAVPFLSYGGSSILSISIAVGLVLSISRDIPNDE